jgi:hypothetical protein
VPKFKMQVRLEGSLKTRADEKEFVRLLEEQLERDIESLTNQFDGSLRLKGVEVGPIKQEGDAD